MLDRCGFGEGVGLLAGEGRWSVGISGVGEMGGGDGFNGEWQ
jgi:hypothetical protein